MPEQLDITAIALQEQAAAGNPAAAALLAGRLVMTVQSKRSGQHITIRANCKRKGAKWVRAGFDVATHVFLEVPRPDGEFPDKVGTYYPDSAPRYVGQFWNASNADRARVWAAIRVLQVAAGLAPWEDDQCEILQGNHCLYCGRELTDPVSIRRQIGPECAETCQVGEHQAKQRGTAAPEPEPVRTPEPRQGVLPIEDPGNRAERELAEREGDAAPTPGLRTVRAGESALTAYQAMLAQEHAAERTEADQS